LRRWFPALDDLLEGARLAVVAALDVEDGQVEEAPPRRRRRPRQQQVLGHEQHDAHGAEDGRGAAHELAVEPHRPSVGTEIDVHLAIEAPVLDARREPRAPRRPRPAAHELVSVRRAESSAASRGSRPPRLRLVFPWPLSPRGR
jgi:hypothetical protein